MPDDTEKHARKVADASGYLFQMAVENEIRRTSTAHREYGTDGPEQTHKWQVHSTEHAWSSPVEGDSGFVDMLLRWACDMASILLVVECKRHKAPTWVFPVSSVATSTNKTRCLYTRFTDGDDRPLASYADATISPPSPEAAYCALHGQSEKGSGELIEREATGLIRGAECIAVEFGQLREKSGFQKYPPTYVLPAIITSVPLSILRFDPVDVSLSDGNLPSDKGDVEMAPLVRFRKSLAHELTPSSQAKRLNQANEDRERTVLIIHAESLISTLQEISVVEEYQEDRITFSLDRLG